MITYSFNNNNNKEEECNNDDVIITAIIKCRTKICHSLLMPKFALNWMRQMLSFKKIKQKWIWHLSGVIKTRNAELEKKHEIPAVWKWRKMACVSWTKRKCNKWNGGMCEKW